MAIIYRFEFNRIFPGENDQEAWNELVAMCKKVAKANQPQKEAQKQFATKSEEIDWGFYCERTDKGVEPLPDEKE